MRMTELSHDEKAPVILKQSANVMDRQNCQSTYCTCTVWSSK